jgi:hypothetical protein
MDVIARLERIPSPHASVARGGVDSSGDRG